MKTRNILLTAFSLSAVAVIYSCQKETTVTTSPTQVLAQQVNLPVTPYEYTKKHGVDANMATLGRVLFFDKNLSYNNTVSCGSCHIQENAFASNVQFDRGYDGQKLARNTPSIQGIKGFETSSFQNNTVTRPTKDNQINTLLFWDGRQKNLSEMVLNPVSNHKEMNMPTFDILKEKLNKLGYYKQLFINAFGDESVDMERIAFAMESFIQCLNTTAPQNFNTAADITTQSKPLSSTEEQGKKLFHQKYNCAKCHDANSSLNFLNNNSGFQSDVKPMSTVTNNGSYGSVSSPTFMFNIGLDETTKDKGLGAVSKQNADDGVFKVPTLRNISLTAPYMHDGRFQTLEQVVDHYSHNIKPHKNLSVAFRNADGTARTLNISTLERDAIVAFLKTLVDVDFISNPMYSDPFKQ